MYESLDPTSIREHLAYYELYQYPPALEHAWKLLSGKSGKQAPLSFPSSIDSFIALINPTESRKAFEISDESLASIDEVAKSLANRKLKGNSAKTLPELLALDSPDIDLARALLLTQLQDFSEIRRYEAMLDLMALQVMARLPANAADQDKVRELNKLIFYELGFRFPPHSTYSQNIDHFTFLPHVLEARRGVCLGVSSLYICLAERIGLPFEIITPPGHIFMRSGAINIETTLRGVHIHDDEYLNINLINLPKRTKKEVIGMAFFNQASIYLSTGDFEKAADCYARALPFMPNDKMLNTLYAFSLILTDKETLAQGYLKKAIQTEEPCLITQNSLAEDMYYKRVDKESLKPFFLYVDESRESIMKKKDAIVQSLKRCPEFRSGHFMLAICWLQLGKPIEAIECLETYEKLDTNDISSAYYLAELYYSRYDGPKAKAAYDRAEKLALKHGSLPPALIKLKTELSIRHP
ncbi:MAG: tetratricopeptide repeat protein [Verrucomicrobia bacterium]|nr:tetratricopeptide repeat protein [Verrucomicrobiota bacterium]MBS0636915.1 tetratricopeptide repeat protein [Verrucomicrobiota bacterium]